jgi:hypothetical protein
VSVQAWTFTAECLYSLNPSQQSVCSGLTLHSGVSVQSWPFTAECLFRLDPSQQSVCTVLTLHSGVSVQSWPFTAECLFRLDLHSGVSVQSWPFTAWKCSVVFKKDKSRAYDDSIQRLGEDLSLDHHGPIVLLSTLSPVTSTTLMMEVQTLPETGYVLSFAKPHYVTRLTCISNARGESSEVFAAVCWVFRL